MADREEKPCVGCGEPTTGMCWTDCGMSLCGAPLCKDCCHVDEKYGWRHEPRLKQEARLVKRLRVSDPCCEEHHTQNEAADRIEQLEHRLEATKDKAEAAILDLMAERYRAEARLAKVIAAFRVGMMRTHDDYTHEAFDALLVDIEGKKDE